MTNPAASPEQPSLFPPDEVVRADASPLTQEQTDEFDRLDAQGMRSSIGVRSEIGAAALTEEPSKFIEFKENGVDVAIPRDIALGLRSGKPAEPKAFKPKSRRGLSGKQRLTADGPPAEYDGR